MDFAILRAEWRPLSIREKPGVRRKRFIFRGSATVFQQDLDDLLSSLPSKHLTCHRVPELGCLSTIVLWFLKQSRRRDASRASLMWNSRLFVCPLTISLQ